MQQHYTSLLNSQLWNCFCTFTSRNAMGNEGFRRMMSHLSYMIKAPEKSSIFWTTEAFKDRTGRHAHALIQTDIPIPHIKKFCEKKYGKCTVELFDKTKNGADYFTKDIGFTSNDYEFIGLRKNSEK